MVTYLFAINTHSNFMSFGVMLYSKDDRRNEEISKDRINKGNLLRVRPDDL